MKKLLKFGGIILVVAGVSFGASLWWSQRGTGLPVTIDRFSDADAKDEAVLAASATKGSVKLTNDDASFAFFIPSREEVRYYTSRTGEIKSLDLKNRSAKAKVVATIKPRAIALTWSPDARESSCVFARLKSSS